MTPSDDSDDFLGLPGEPGQQGTVRRGGKGGGGGRGGRGARGERGPQGTQGESSVEGVRKAIRRYQRSALAGFLLLLAGIGVTIQVDSSRSADARQSIVESARAVSIIGCNRDLRTNLKLRGILEASRLSTEERFEAGEITKAQRDRAVAFYNEQVAEIPAPDCRRLTDIISDDANKPVVVPEPLYPGHPALEQR